MIKQKINSVIEKLTNAIFSFYRKRTYNNISDKNFKMDRYIDLLVNNNLNALRKYKITYPKSVLFGVYSNIQQQYVELSKNKEITAKMKRKQRKDILIKKYNLLIACGTVLSVQPENQDVLEFLNSNSIKGDDMLKRIETECKVLQSKIEELQSFDEQEKSKEKKSEPLSEAYYSRIFALLNKNGYKADRNMSVLDFIETMNIYKQEIEENNKQLDKLKSKK